MSKTSYWHNETGKPHRTAIERSNGDREWLTSS